MNNLFAIFILINLLFQLCNSRWKEALDLQSFEFETPFIGIIKLSSEIAKAVMDRCVSMDRCPADNSELIVNILNINNLSIYCLFNSRFNVIG